MSESMRKNAIFISFASAFCLLVAASCSLTNLNAVWKDPQYQGGKLQNILVIGGTKNQIVRRIIEDEFTARFKSRDTNAIQSYTIFPSEKTLDKDTIESQSRDLGIDSILIARVVDVKTKQQVSPTPSSYYYRDIYFYDWPNRSSRFYTGPIAGGYYNNRVYLSEYEVANFETSLYETQTGKLIWSALSDTFIGGDTLLEVSSVVDVIIKNLAGAQLIN